MYTLIISLSLAQDRPQVKAIRIEEEIKIDGLLNEANLE